MAKYSKDDVRIRIHRRIRLKVRGTEERPRLAVFRSLKHIYAQVIDDKRGHTMVAASSVLDVGRDAHVDAACARVPSI